MEKLVGKLVRGSDGRKLGRVMQLDESRFMVEKGIFFQRDYYLAYGDIDSVINGEIWLKLPADVLLAGAERPATETRPHLVDRTVEPIPAPPAAYSTEQADVRIPITEEEVGVEKFARKAGELLIHKEVVTETKHISTPVSHEEVRIERVSLDGKQAAEPGEMAFQKSTVSVPVYEEEVEIHKRPVVKEELHVAKERIETYREDDVSLRKEKVEFEKKGRLEGSDLMAKGSHLDDDLEKT